MAAILLWFFATILHVSATDRVSNAVVEFDFPRAECIARQFEDTVSSSYIGDLRRNVTTTSCLDGIGIRGNSSDDTPNPRLQSTATVSNLIPLIGNQGFSIELWLQPDDITESSPSYEETSPVFTMGSSSSYTCSDYDDYNLILEQVVDSSGARLTVGGRITNPDASYDNTISETFVLGTDYSSTQNHIVIVVNETYVITYVNGVASDDKDEWFPSSLGSSYKWNDVGTSSYDSDYHLQFFDNLCSTYNSGVPHGWNGDIYLFAIYKKALQSDEVLQNYLAKLPNSVPLVTDMAVTIQEDGEVGSHYDTPEWYLEEVPVSDLVTVSLNAVDVDEDPSYINFDSDDDPMKVYITSLPPSDRVKLYQMNGQEIATVPTEIPASSRNYTLRVRPGWNAYSGTSVFANFSFYAVDGVSGDRSTSTATVFLKVSAVNDPAIPRQGLNSTVYAGRTTVLELQGNAVESTDSVIRGYISRLPSAGSLFFANSTSYGSAPISLTGGIVTLPHESLSVAYVYTGSQDLPADSDGIIFTDSFGFRLLDADGKGDDALGVERNFTVLVRVGVVACADSCDSAGSASAQNVNEEDTGSIKLYGKDYSDTPGYLKFTIVSLPDHGALKDPVTGDSLAVGDSLTTIQKPPYSSPVIVYYTSDKDYFNYPSTSFNGSSLGAENDNFKFAVESLNKSNTTSASTSISVQVKNVNDYPVFGNITGSYSVYAFGYTDDDSDDPEYETTITIPEIKIHDADRNVDPVVIYIKASYGQFSLNSKHLDGVYFTGSLCDSVGCAGDGDGDSYMRFVGTPRDVNMALRDLTYYCTEPDVTDYLSVYVYDGDSSVSCTTSHCCLDGDDLDDENCCSDRSSGCLVSVAEVPVSVGTFSSVAKAASSDCSAYLCLDWKYWLAILVMTMVLLLFGCVKVWVMVLTRPDEYEEVEREKAAEERHKRWTEKCPRCYCILNWVFCFVLFLYRIFCIACFCYCCCLCCPKKSKRTEREARSEIQEALSDQEAFIKYIRDPIERKILMRIPCCWCSKIRNCFFCILCCPLRTCVGRYLCCCFLRLLRIVLYLLPRRNKKKSGDDDIELQPVEGAQFTQADLDEMSLPSLRELCNARGLPSEGPRDGLEMRILESQGGPKVTREDLDEMSLTQLRECCEARNLESSGYRYELVERIMQSQADPGLGDVFAPVTNEPMDGEAEFSARGSEMSFSINPSIAVQLDVVKEPLSIDEYRVLVLDMVATEFGAVDHERLEYININDPRRWEICRVRGKVRTQKYYYNVYTKKSVWKKPMFHRETYERINHMLEKGILVEGAERVLELNPNALKNPNALADGEKPVIKSALMPAKQFQCQYRCGFTGTYDKVVAHESICSLCPTRTETSTNIMHVGEELRHSFIDDEDPNSVPGPSLDEVETPKPMRPSGVAEISPTIEPQVSGPGSGEAQMLQAEAGVAPEPLVPEPLAPEPVAPEPLRASESRMSEPRVSESQPQLRPSVGNRPSPSANAPPPSHSVVADFSAEENWQVSVTTGEAVSMVADHGDGWCEVVTSTGAKGGMPTSFLSAIDPGPSEAALL